MCKRIIVSHMCKRILDSNFISVNIDEISIFLKIAPNFTYVARSRGMSHMSAMFNFEFSTSITCPFKGPSFSFEWGVMNFESTTAIFLWPPYLMIKNFMTPPFGATMLKKHVIPNARSAEKICIFGAISLNKISSKICSHPIISWLFLWPPLFLMKKFCDPPAFSWPPYSEENDSPLKCYILIKTLSQSDIWLQRYEHSLKFKNKEKHWNLSLL